MNPVRADLRSDTVTRPTPAMREAMAHAEVGDDVFGEDPTVSRLEALSAQLFGHEAALFVASGTMANQLAIHVHTRPGERVIVGWSAHSIAYEAGAAAALSGVQLDALPVAVFDAAQAAALWRPGTDVHDTRTALVMVENTHNRAGGTVYPLDALREVSALCAERGARLHMDGARVFNAVAASGVAPADYGRAVDSLSFCLSKGLGCPVGSVLVGSAAFVAQARRARKRFGGGMRQAGILAAAGIHALTHHVDRLADDHRRAARLAEGWGALRGAEVPPPQTNMVYLTLTRPDLDAETVCRRLAEAGVRVLPVGPRQIRAVVHLDVDDAGVDAAISALRDALAA